MQITYTTPLSTFVTLKRNQKSLFVRPDLVKIVFTKRLCLTEKKEEIEQKRTQARLAAFTTPDPHAASFGSTPGTVVAAQPQEAVDPNRVIPNQRKPRPTVVGQFEKAKVWRTDDKNQPAFPAEYDLIYYDTLQVRALALLMLIRPRDLRQCAM